MVTEPTPTSLPTLAVPVASLLKAAAEPERMIEPPSLAEAPGPFYISRRVIAFSLDLALNSALCAAAFTWILANMDTPPEPGPEALLLASAIFASLHWALVTAQELAFGTSAGKRIAGLSLHGSVPAVFLRAFFFIPSVAFGGIGLIWALFDSRGRCWHDAAVDLQPLESGRS